MLGRQVLNLSIRLNLGPSAQDMILHLVSLVGIFTLIVSCGQETVTEVHVFPHGYRVGSVQSELATPAVDEVVRIKPSRVVILACINTPPAWAVQFHRELVARWVGPVQGGILKDGC